MFRKKTPNPLYRFKAFEKEARWASVNYGEKDETYLEKKSWRVTSFIWLAAFIPRIIDFNVRLWDFWRNRSYGGRLESIGIVGHSPIALLLPVGLIYFLFFGPSGGHWNWIGYKYILVPAVIIAILILGFSLHLNRNKDGKSPSSQRTIFDFLRLFIWILGTTFVIGCFSRGLFAHVGFLAFTTALWIAFAFGSRVDDNTENKKSGVGHSFLRRLPWVCGFYLLVGFISFHHYVKPMEKETGTGLLWFWVYVIFISAFLLISTALFVRTSREEQHYGSISLWVQLGIVIVAGWVTWYFGGLREIEHDLYRHVMIPLTVVMLVVPLSIASVLARIIFRSRIKLVESQFHHLLNRVEVFQWPELPPLNPNKVFRSFLVTLRHVLMLLFPPALAVFLMPYFLRAYLEWIGAGVFLITFGILGYASIHDRLGHLISIYRGMFFHGMQLVVSTLVIVLGITRLADIGYVSYIVEASPLTLLTFIVVAYLLLWFSEYWINRMFGEEFLALLDPDSRACGKVEFNYDNDNAYRESVRSRVKAEGRKLQLHGSGQLVVVGDRQWFTKNPTIEFSQSEIDEKRENCVVISLIEGSLSFGIFDMEGHRLKKRDQQLAEKINNNMEVAEHLRILWEKGDADSVELRMFLENCGIINFKDTKEEELENKKKQVDTEKGWDGNRFQFYNKFDFLGHLVENAVLSDFDFAGNLLPSNGGNGDMVVRKSLTKVRERLRWHVQDLRKQYVSYYAMLTMILAIGIVFQVLTLTTLVDPAALSILSPTVDTSGSTAGQSGQNQNLYNLRSQLFGKAGAGSKDTTDASVGGDPEEPEPVILLAASGGGSRAALYIVSVLQGLAKLDRLDNVKLVSGVSGGGAAIAYFYGHRDELLKTSHGQPWADFYDAVSKGFIVRCLRGSGERRIAGGIRLGTLLDEGFQDHFFGGSAPTIGGKDIGVLFNTAVAGEVHPPQSSNIDLALWAQEYPKRAKSWSAGTRLIVSNILEATLLQDIHDVPRDGLRYTSVVHPDAKLSTAAALNANFPPVFSNAAVDIDGHRYWVTDGGAMDNRGLITLLYVLREALNAQLNMQGENKFVYPDIHIIVADASATSFDYTSKRGFGALFGSSRKLATGLIDALSEEVQALYTRIHGQNEPKIHIHNLSMPLTLRARGGLGTHWVMPVMARFSSCTKEDPGDDDWLILTRNQIVRAIAGLHQPCGKDNIGELIVQDSLLVRRQGNEDDLNKLVGWYSPDAIYLRDFAFLSNRDSEKDTENVIEAKEKIVNSHPAAWKKIENDLKKQ